MTIDGVYQKYEGQSVSFDGLEENRGQCVQWVELVHTEAYGQPAHYADASDWYNNPGELLDFYERIPVGPFPLKGDLVVWGPGVGSQYGHIDVCMRDGNTGGFQGADSNWAGNKTVHLVHHDYRFVLGYLRPKSQEEDMPNDGDIDNVYQEFNTRKATEEEKKVYREKTWSAGDGLYYGKVAVEVKKLKDALASAQNSQFATVTEQLFKKK